MGREAAGYGGKATKKLVPALPPASPGQLPLGLLCISRMELEAHRTGCCEGQWGAQCEAADCVGHPCCANSKAAQTCLLSVGRMWELVGGYSLKGNFSFCLLQCWDFLDVPMGHEGTLAGFRREGKEEARRRQL